MRFTLIGAAAILAACSSVEAFVVSRSPVAAASSWRTATTTATTLNEASSDDSSSLMDKLMEPAATTDATATTTITESSAASDAAATTPIVVDPAPAVSVAPPPAADAAAIADLKTVALVAGQENYGLAVVLLGEAIWSFSQAPSVDHGVKTLLPAIVAAAVLVVVSGPMVTSEDAGSVFTGLGIATGVSVLMGVAYAARLAAPFSPSPKEIPALGLLVALAGFFSFSQNLVVDGFVQLPSLPPLPSLPTIDLPF